MEHARRLTIVEMPGYTRVTVTNPWDTARVLHEYLLVPDSLPLPDPLPAGTLLRTPLRSLVVHTAVHCRMLDELGALETIKGVCDAQFISLPELKNGAVADCGRAYGPDVERIMSLRPDAVMVSPFPDSGTYGKLGVTGIPVIECADYMEPTPLGRAEWVRFYGRLMGKAADADSIFAATAGAYQSLKAAASTVTERPAILFDHLYSGRWYVPARYSTTATMVRDAGATNPFDYVEGTQSQPLTSEQVLVKAADAPLWLVRYTAPEPLTRSELLAESPLYSRFRAFGGSLYGCDTSETLYFELIPFHPELMLGTLISLAHPELGVGENRFFTPLQ